MRLTKLKPIKKFRTGEMIRLDMSKVKKISLAENKETRTYKRFVDVVLDELDHPEALVTDESYVSDFICFMDSKRRKKILERMSNRFGFEINQYTRIIDVAKKLREQEQ